MDLGLGQGRALRLADDALDPRSRLQDHGTEIGLARLSGDRDAGHGHRCEARRFHLQVVAARSEMGEAEASFGIRVGLELLVVPTGLRPAPEKRPPRVPHLHRHETHGGAGDGASASSTTRPAPDDPAPSTTRTPARSSNGASASISRRAGAKPHLRSSSS